MGWRFTVVAVLVLGAVASYCAVIAAAIRDFDEGMNWE